jgi:hypothetical protein
MEKVFFRYTNITLIYQFVELILAAEGLLAKG